MFIPELYRDQLLTWCYARLNIFLVHPFATHAQLRDWDFHHQQERKQMYSQGYYFFNTVHQNAVIAFERRLNHMNPLETIFWKHIQGRGWVLFYQ